MPKAKSKAVMKLVIIGEAPNRFGDVNKPLEGSLGRRLADLFGCTMDEYLRRTDRHNVFGHWPGKLGKGDAFPMMEALLAVPLLFKQCEGHRVLLLGQRVRDAFGYRGMPMLTWESHFLNIGIINASWISHPSSINRWWNDAKNRQRANHFMRMTWNKA